MENHAASTLLEGIQIFFEAFGSLPKPTAKEQFSDYYIKRDLTSAAIPFMEKLMNLSDHHSAQTDAFKVWFENLNKELVSSEEFFEQAEVNDTQLSPQLAGETATKDTLNLSTTWKGAEVDVEALDTLDSLNATEVDRKSTKLPKSAREFNNSDIKSGTVVASLPLDTPAANTRGRKAGTAAQKRAISNINIDDPKDYNISSDSDDTEITILNPPSLIASPHLSTSLSSTPNASEPSSLANSFSDAPTETDEACFSDQSPQSTINNPDSAKAHSDNASTSYASITATQNNDRIPDSEQFQYQTPRKPAKITPIYIKHPNLNWNICRNLLEEAKFKGYTGKSKTDGTIILTCSDGNQHRKITSFLNQKRIQFSCYPVEDDTVIKVVIRGLPVDIDMNDVKGYLIDENFPVTHVSQLTRRRRGEVTKHPLFMATLTKSAQAKRIYQLPFILNMKVKIETYRGRGGAIQCHRCQQFNHTQRTCNNDPRCLKCAGNHLTNTCLKSKNLPATCANCGGDHTANFPGCIHYPKPMDIEPAHSLNDQRTTASNTIESATDTTLNSRQYSKPSSSQQPIYPFSNDTLQMQIRSASTIIEESTKVLSTLKLTLLNIQSQASMLTSTTNQIRQEGNKAEIHE